MISSDSNSRNSYKRVEREERERGLPSQGSYRRESGKGRLSTPPDSATYFKRESGKGRPCTPPEEPSYSRRESGKGRPSTPPEGAPYFKRESGKGHPSTPPEYYRRETGKGRPSTPPEGPPQYYRKESARGRPSTPPEEPPNLGGRSRYRVREKDVYIDVRMPPSPPLYEELEYRRHKQPYQRERQEQQRYRSGSSRRSGANADFNEEGRPHSWDDERMSSGGGPVEVEGRRHGSSEDGSRSLTPVAMMEEDWLTDEDEATPPPPRAERRRGERPPSSQRGAPGADWNNEGRSKMYTGDREQRQRDEVCKNY